MYFCFETDSKRLTEWLLDILDYKNIPHKVKGSNDDLSYAYITVREFPDDDKWFCEQFFTGVFDSSITGAFRVGEFRSKDPESVIKTANGSSGGHLPDIKTAFARAVSDKDNNTSVVIPKSELV